MPRTPGLLIVLLLALAATPACFVRSRPSQATRQPRPLLTATKDELVQRVRENWDPIQSFMMKVDLAPSVIDPSTGVTTDYATVGAYILFRKPQDIRILGRDPVIGSTIFDMVSDGNEFRVSFPRKKRFVIGSNDAPATSENRLEYLRPTALLTSLMICSADPRTDFAAIENDPERALYILLIMRWDQGQFVLARNIYFDRYTLEITRQKTFDRAGNMISDTKYSDWKSYSGLVFPSSIDIQRPRENYEVLVSIVSMRINTPDITAQKFILERPPNTELHGLR